MAYSEQRKKGYSYSRPLWQWIAIYLVIGGLIYAAVYYFFLKKSPNPYGSASTTSQPVAQNTVTITATGFQPADIVIKAGSTVTWTNNSGTDATVNSDPHPTHTDYPPLNIGAIANGATASLTFPTAGKHGYHNHFQPSQTGSVTVQ